MTPPARPALPYLRGYPETLRQEVQGLIDRDELAGVLQRRYPQRHNVRTDAALYDYTQALKSTHLRQSPPLAKVIYAARLHVIHNALGTHTTVARVQGGQLKAKREIRISAMFRDTPPEFLKMIVVHELAHIKEREHGKAFYALCQHMEPDYHQFEFDLRLYLTLQEIKPATTVPRETHEVAPNPGSPASDLSTAPT